MLIIDRLKQLSRPAVRKTFIAAMIFLIVYTVAGFFVLPPIFKYVLTRKLTEELHREVAIRQIKTNPFVLSVSVRGFLVKDRNGRDAFMSFEELYLNLQSISILKRGLILSEIRVNKPYVNIVRNEDGSYNFSDLLVPKPKKEATKPRFSLNNIQILNGSIDFSDGPKHTAHKLRDMDIKIPFISSLPYYVNIYVRPSFEAKVNGTPVSFKGETKPFKDSLETHLDISIRDLDLPFYMAYSPFKLPFNMSSGLLNVDTVMSYNQYRDKPPSLNVSGDVVLKKIKIVDLKQNPLLSLPAFEISVDRSDLIARKIHLAKAILTSLELGKRGDKVALLNIPLFSLKDASVDLIKNEANIGEVSTEKGVINIKRYKDGKLNIQDLVPEAGTSGSGSIKTKKGPALLVTLKDITVSNYAVKVEDSVPTEPVSFLADHIDLKGTDLSTAEKSRGMASLSFMLNKRGSIKTDGYVTIDPPSADMRLDVKDIRISPFQSYFTERVKILITQGDISLNGRVSAAYSEDGIVKASYKGVAAIKKFTSLDKTNADDFLKWDSLYFGGIDAAINPLHVKIAQVSLTDFYSRIIIDKDGSINLQKILEEEGGGEPAAAQKKTEEPVIEAYARPAETAPTNISGGEPQKPSAAAQGNPAEAATKPPVASARQKPKELIKVDTVTFQGGTINFSDRHIEPNYSSSFFEIGGRVSGLSSEDNKFADVDLRGRLENYAPLEITGKINPLRDDLYVDLRIDFKNMDLSTVSPYSGRYLGYTIQKGKLSLGMQYLIVNKKLDAQNNIFLDQFTLGERVESPKATKLPVRLAIALLKNRKGEINLDVPISGYINDPNFSIGGIVIKIFLNLLAKAATSPFALLGALFGGGQELSYVEFDYGSHHLAESDTKKLDTLVKALYDRPALKIEIEGHADIEKDKEGLRQYLFMKKLKAQKLKDLVNRDQPAVPVDEITIGKDEYEKYLKMAYKAEKFPKPKTMLFFDKALPAPEMEKLMLTHIVVTDNDLRQLASQRALAAKDYILKSGQVTPDRVFLIEPKSLEPEKKDKLKNSRVDFILK